jgi:methionine-rich copper-binding protein CopC
MRFFYPQRENAMNKFTVLVAALAVTLWSAAALAHARLQSSTPASNAQLAHAPATLELNFSEEAKLAVLKLTTAGTQIPVTLDRGVQASKKIVVTLPALQPGTYEVQWSAIAKDDGHVTKGMFSFVVQG